MNQLFTKRLGVFLIRLAVIVLVFFLIKLTVDPEDFTSGGGLFTFDSSTLFYFLTAFFLFMLTWESNDALIRWELRRQDTMGITLFGGFRILILTMAILLPVAALIYYLGIYHWEDLCKIVPEERGLRFRIDFLRAALLGLTVIIFNLFYHTLKQKTKVEARIADLTRVITESRYQGLKSQISPHFLFNSLNTLTSLMYEDRDLASDFVTRLASTYRYILDHRSEDLASLGKELEFLDAYLFMMEVRHRSALTVNYDIQDEIKSLQIPTLSLQLLMENALKHNAFSEEMPLKIEIGNIAGEALYFRNNLQKRTLRKDEESTGIGLENIRQRYAYYTNKSVLVREQSGFFEVIIPLLGRDVDRTDLKLIGGI